MSETGFRVFNIAYGLGADLAYAFLLTAFFHPFMAIQSRKWRKLPIVFTAYILCELISNWITLPRGSFGLILMIMLLAASKWIGMDKSLVFLLVILYSNARISSGLMVESLYFMIERLLPSHTEPLEAVFIRAVVLSLFFLLAHSMLFFALLYALQRQLRKRHMPLHWRELCYISLVPVAGILFGQVISRLLFEIEDGVLLQLYERHPAFLAVVPVLALLFYAGTYLTIAFQELLYRGWFHHLLYMTAVHLWQNGTLQL